MLSYLNAQPSTVMKPVGNTDGSRTWQEIVLVEKKESECDKEKEQIKKFQAQMIAVPAGSSARTNSKSKKFRKGIISKTYNPQASRPLARSLNTQRTYEANMRYDATLLTSSTVAEVTVGVNFQLSSFAGNTAFLALFDQYKILELEVWIECMTSPSVQLTNLGLLSSSVDFDDSNTPTAFANVEEKQSSVNSNAFSAHYHKFKPHMAVALYAGAFTSFGNEEAGWIDSASSSVQHYGLKAATTVMSSACVFKMSVRGRVSFRQAGL